MLIELIKPVLFSILYCDKFIIFKKLLFDPIPSLKPKKEIIIKTANERDIKDMIKFIGKHRVNKFLKRLKGNKVCMIGLNKENIIYYRWMNFEKDNLIEIEDKEVYLFDSYTLPGYRRLGIHTVVTAECLKFAKEKGCEQAVVSASVRNLPARRTLMNLGFREVGKVTLFKIPWLKLQHKYIEYNKIYFI